LYCFLFLAFPTLLNNEILHQQLWGYKVEWRSVSRSTGGKKVEYHWSRRLVGDSRNIWVRWIIVTLHEICVAVCYECLSFVWSVLVFAVLWCVYTFPETCSGTSHDVSSHTECFAVETKITDKMLRLWNKLQSNYVFNPGNTSEP
jgi:hypothetical protein